jgi:AcrR family transcriptional regulator
MAVAALQTRRDERREGILDVARDCFLAEGYAATSMSTIAARLGGSKGTLYNYFKNKEDLFAAVMQRQCAELAETLFDVQSLSSGMAARLKHFARNFLQRLMDPNSVALHRLVMGEGGRFPEIGRVFYESGPKVVMSRIAGFLEDDMKAGRLRRADPAVAAQQLKDLAISGVYWPRLWGVLDDFSEADAEAQADVAVAPFLRAYAPER